MNIQIAGKYRITSDEMNLILSKRIYSKKTPEKEIWRIMGYYPDFESLTNGLVDTCIYAIEASSMQKMIKGTSDLKRELLAQIVASHNNNS